MYDFGDIAHREIDQRRRNAIYLALMLVAAVLVIGSIIAAYA